ncbi:MAG: hypothetical protein FJ224_02385 [Lentisphaerae bacterium]|nr:hypothetical protein [Lentisphaerota bacterium]
MPQSVRKHRETQRARRLPRLPGPFTLAVAAAVAAHFCLALYAGHLNGRALWCDEILRVWAQQMSLRDLLRCEHIRQFCTQSPMAYFVQRPFVSAFGREAGGIAASAAFGAALLAVAACVARRRLGPTAGWLALLLGGTQPLLLYYSSELALYIIWAAASGGAFAFVSEAMEDPGRRRGFLFNLGAALCVFGMVSFHFSGVFVWMALAAAWAVALAPPAFPGMWRGWARWALVMAPPMALAAPVYAKAQAVQSHLGSREIDWALLPAAMRDALWYLSDNLHVLAGGDPARVGLALLLAGFGIYAWAGTGRARRGRLAWLTAALLAVALFRMYTRLRGTGPPVISYHLYAWAPVIVAQSAAAAWLFSPRRRGWVRVAGAVALACLVSSNAFSLYVVARAPGRSHPYKAIGAAVADLGENRVVVSPNQYVTRFLGTYYSVPRGGIVTYPCYWEEGEEERIGGMRRIWGLVPDAVAFISHRTLWNEFDKAGVYAPTVRSFEYPVCQRIGFAFLGYTSRFVPGEESFIAYATRRDLEIRAASTGAPVSLPVPPFALALQRDANAAASPLLVGETFVFDVFAPAAGSHILSVDIFAYGSKRILVSVPPAPTMVLDLPSGSGLSFQVGVPNPVWKPGVPPPEYLLADSLGFVLDLKLGRIEIPFQADKPGWRRVTIRASQAGPMLLVGHRAVARGG